MAKLDLEKIEDLERLPCELQRQLQRHLQHLRKERDRNETRIVRILRLLTEKTK